MRVGDRQVQVCRAYNEGRTCHEASSRPCADTAPCGRMHICKKCKSADHRELSCPKGEEDVDWTGYTEFNNSGPLRIDDADF